MRIFLNNNYRNLKHYLWCFSIYIVFKHSCMMYFKDVPFFLIIYQWFSNLFSSRIMFLNVITCRNSIYKTDKNGVDLIEAASALPFCSVFDLGIQFENHYFNQFNIFNDIFFPYFYIICWTYYYKKGKKNAHFQWYMDSGIPPEYI